MTSRRTILNSIVATGVLSAFGCSSSRQRSSDAARVAIIGGGFAGATCARQLRKLDPQLAVTLIEPAPVYTACPFSNLVIAGMRDIRAQRFGYAALEAEGIRVVRARAHDVDPVSHKILLVGGDVIAYDRLVIATGASPRFDALPGYDAAAAQIMPHAWQAGPQTLLLRKQLRAMPEGGVVAISVPPEPYRCPPGPYERASLIAHYLQSNNPRAKVLILDSKDRFSKQALFQQAWQDSYPGMIEWAGLSDGANVVRVEPATMTIHTDFDAVRADVANIIPPQSAGRLVRRAGVADASGWCPVEPASFASRLQQDIHVIGDAAIANGMPKSAFAANAQAKLCAVQVARALRGQPPVSTKLINTCYSYISPQQAISVADVYTPEASLWQPVAGAGGTSPLDASSADRAKEAGYAANWFAAITAETFG